MELWRWGSHFWDPAFQVLKALNRTTTKPCLGFKVRHEGLKVRSHFWDPAFQALKVENKIASKPCWVFKVNYGGLKVRSRFWDLVFQVLRLSEPGQTTIYLQYNHLGPQINGLLLDGCLWRTSSKKVIRSFVHSSKKERKTDTTFAFIYKIGVFGESV